MPNPRHPPSPLKVAVINLSRPFRTGRWIEPKDISRRGLPIDAVSCSVEQHKIVNQVQFIIRRERV